MIVKNVTLWFSMLALIIGPHTAVAERASTRHSGETLSVMSVSLHARLTHFDENLHLIIDPPQNYTTDVLARH